MKTLFTNGCSWTAGGGFDFADTKENTDNLLNNIVWPAQLGKKLGYDKVVNLAEGCGSNQRICRTTFEWVMKQTPETLKNTRIIIQWSCEDRFEYYVETKEEKDMAEEFNKFYSQVGPSLSENIKSHQISPLYTLKGDYTNTNFFSYLAHPTRKSSQQYTK